MPAFCKVLPHVRFKHCHRINEEGASQMKSIHTHLNVLARSNLAFMTTMVSDKTLAISK